MGYAYGGYRHFGKRSADAEPEADAAADAYYGYYGRGYGYGHGYGYGRGYYGYGGYGLGYGWWIRPLLRLDSTESELIIVKTPLQLNTTAPLPIATYIQFPKKIFRPRNIFFDFLFKRSRPKKYSSL